MDKFAHYSVVLIPGEDGFAVCCPGLPGCWSQGKDEAEALENSADAIKEYLAVAEELWPDGMVREANRRALHDLRAWDDEGDIKEEVVVRVLSGLEDREAPKPAVGVAHRLGLAW